MRNFDRSDIDWCDIGLNAYTGCLNGCTYCYADGICNRFKLKILLNFNIGTDLETVVLKQPCYTLNNNGKKIATPYPFGFKPTYRKYLMQDFDEYLYKYISKYGIFGNLSEKDYSRREDKLWTASDKYFLPLIVFISPFGDIMGNWVDESIINDHLDLCQKHNDINWVWLTKNPNRYKHYVFPKNCWLGTTVTNQSDTHRLSELIKTKNLNKNQIIFASIEPILGTIEISNMNQLSWIIIGCQTGKGAKPYNIDAVESLIQQAKACNVPVFLKDNLKWHEVIKEFTK